MADLQADSVMLALVNPTNIVFSNEAIEISHLPGTSGTAVISFAGIGMGFGGVQIEEFRRSLAGRPNDLIFVKDKSRTWYNESFDQVGKILSDALQRLLIRDTITIGNSMDGFGAIAFAARLPHCSRVIAFAAQSSVDPNVVSWEHRFDRWLAPVENWSALDATQLLDSRIQYRLFFGDGDPNDIRHAERFVVQHSSGMSICIIEGCGHDVAVFLKRHNLLRSLLDDLVVRDDSGQWIRTLQSVQHRFLGPSTGLCQ
jgi:hypothetical protein